LGNGSVCDVCGGSDRVFIDHYEDHLEPPCRLNICLGCHTRLHAVGRRYYKGFSSCGRSDCLICKLGLEKYCRVAAIIALWHLYADNFNKFFRLMFPAALKVAESLETK